MHTSCSPPPPPPAPSHHHHYHQGAIKSLEALHTSRPHALKSWTWSPCVHSSREWFCFHPCLPIASAIGNSRGSSQLPAAPFLGRRRRRSVWSCLTCWRGSRRWGFVSGCWASPWMLFGTASLPLQQGRNWWGRQTHLKKQFSIFVLFHERVHASCFELHPVVIRWPDTVSKRLMQTMSHTLNKNTKSSLCYVNTTKQTMGMILFPSKWSPFKWWLKIPYPQWLWSKWSQQ